MKKERIEQKITKGTKIEEKKFEGAVRRGILEIGFSAALEMAVLGLLACNDGRLALLPVAVTCLSRWRAWPVLWLLKKVYKKFTQGVALGYYIVPFQGLSTKRYLTSCNAMSRCSISFQVKAQLH